ncbi:MAG: hypothetical protein IK012_07620 [Fibrobacter sp.]|uniref:hypothetical protein n=1 Tax=Fibrobacter sp. TaxID=35828 RepID=UPI0025BA92D9|nr:hypothetical protein [Fibrobacter sp.]MBR4785105.1 hypothetical protein [Fibrobacter sp.]
MFKNTRKNTTAGRAPKKLVAGRFHASSSKSASGQQARQNNSRQGQKAAPAKPAPAKARVASFEDLKQQLAAWAENERVPGKIQAWFTRDAVSEHSDWRIINKLVNGHETLVLDAPAKGMEPPEPVQGIFDQLHKDHLRTIKKALRQIWFRATGDGRFALLIQANVHGKNSGHEIKTLVEFIQHNYPQVISCHQIQCTPNHIFDPAAQLKMRVDMRGIFGSAFMPIAGTGFSMHVLDWSPRIKDAWIELPERIRDAIHPAAGDKFFEFYCGPSLVASSLAQDFDQVDTLDCRESAMESSKMNSRNLAGGSLKFHRGHLEAAFLEKFFSHKDNEGRWTFYLNVPVEEPLNAEQIQAIAGARPERIILQAGDLESAGKYVKRFRAEGYMLRKNIPLYLEPGTGKFDLLMLFVPDRVGVLGGFAAKNSRNLKVERPREQVFRKKQGDIPHFVQKK